MKTICLTHPSGFIQGAVKLPSSKSISNRLLVLQAVSKGKISIQNLSDSEDTLILQQALTEQNQKEIYLGNAGTAMRFLTAFFSGTEREVTLTGDQRMYERPLGELVSALRTLGANITCKGKEDFPPLHIKGKQLSGGEVSLNNSMSSQFCSALMMIAPTLEGGLCIKLNGNILSSSYIKMTTGLMKKCGLKVIDNKNTIEIPQQDFAEVNITVEQDWSAASAWYAMASLAKKCDILLEGLTESNLQGDAGIVQWMQTLGVMTSFEKEGVRLQKSQPTKSNAECDLSSSPDLVPAIAVAAAGNHFPIQIKNIAQLKVKESDRIKSLETELGKVGFNTKSGEDYLEIISSDMPHSISGMPLIHTYNDHRIAMSFAALAIPLDGVCIENSECVHKSYRGFWDEIKKAGFEIAGPS